MTTRWHATVRCRVSVHLLEASAKNSLFERLRQTDRRADAVGQSPTVDTLQATQFVVMRRGHERRRGERGVSLCRIVSPMAWTLSLKTTISPSD